MYLLGFDIGGTKCAAVTAEWDGESITLLDREVIPTASADTPIGTISLLCDAADHILKRKPDAIGVSCGGPLDSERGVILNPPNLPGWINVEIVRLLEARYGVPAKLQNDANACTVAEWKFGAGRGKKNVVFLTFGTGLGAGLILDGRLYGGTNGNAGEVGHLRLERFGPVGYGKSGSFEGFCSGGGIAQLAYQMALEKVQSGVYPAYFRPGMTLSDVSAKSVAEAAEAGDETALAVYRVSGEQLGAGLSVIVDLLNPEVIVIGSIFARSRHLLWESAERVLRKEALPASLSCTAVVPAALGERIGDYAAVATALL